MKARKIFGRILLYLLAVLTIGLLVRAFFNYRMGNKLEEYIGNRQAEGVALSRKALMPDCSDAENGANLWRAAEALYSREGLNVALLRDAMESIFYGKPFEPGVRDELKGMIGKNTRVFQFMEEASEKSCFRYGDWSQKIYDIKIPDAVKMINAVRLLGIDAVFKAEEGKIQEAIDQIRWGICLVQKTMDEPFTITGLVAIANLKHLIFSLNQITSGRNIDPEILSILIQDLNPGEWRKKFARNIQGERAFYLEIALGVLEGDRTIFNISQAENTFFWFIRPVIKAETLWALKKYDDVESQSLLPFYKVKEFQREFDQEVESIPWYYYVAKNVFPNFHAMWLKEAILEAVMGGGQIALACKIYKEREGNFPENIAELIPGILAEEPVDPFTGDPFIYKLQENGFVVYSVGSNEKDDEGRATYQVTKLVMEKDDDWPWRERTK